MTGVGAGIGIGAECADWALGDGRTAADRLSLTIL